MALPSTRNIRSFRRYLRRSSPFSFKGPRVAFKVFIGMICPLVRYFCPYEMTRLFWQILFPGVPVRKRAESFNCLRFSLSISKIIRYHNAISQVTRYRFSGSAFLSGSFAELFVKELWTLSPKRTKQLRPDRPSPGWQRPCPVSLSADNHSFVRAADDCIIPALFLRTQIPTPYHTDRVIVAGRPLWSCAAP